MSFQECCPKRCARPTGGSHGLTTRGPAQRAEGAKPRSVFYGAVSRSMRSTSSRGMWTAPALGSETSGVSAALGRILAAVVRATDEGIWGRLKVCTNDACEWAFYDRSKNRSGKWCTMEVCGNRMKARTFRERQGTREG